MGPDARASLNFGLYFFFCLCMVGILFAFLPDHHSLALAYAGLGVAGEVACFLTKLSVQTSQTSEGGKLPSAVD